MNILSFEYVREKLGEGKPAREAPPAEESNALRTIFLDANEPAVIARAVRA